MFDWIIGWPFNLKLRLLPFFSSSTWSFHNNVNISLPSYEYIVKPNGSLSNYHTEYGLIFCSFSSSIAGKSSANYNGAPTGTSSYSHIAGGHDRPHGFAFLTFYSSTIGLSSPTCYTCCSGNCDSCIKYHIAGS